MDITLKIEGMTCDGCKAAVERVLAAQPGVAGATVDLDAGRAVVATGGGVSTQALIDAVENAGYEARVEG